MKYISLLVIPSIFLVIVGYGLYKKVNIFEVFLEGAAEGIATSIKILPALVGLVAAITMLRTSGALDFVIKLMNPFTKTFSIPSEVIPLALLRPITGSGALAIVGDILKNYGADSMQGYIASVMMGSSETTFYTLAVYFGSVGITKTRYTVKAAMVADMAAIILSVVVVKMFF